VTWIVQLDERARLLIPSDVRKRLGIRKGDAVALELSPDGALQVLPLRVRLRAAKGLFRSQRRDDESVVDALLEERRAEAVQEHDG